MLTGFNYVSCRALVWTLLMVYPLFNYNTKLGLQIKLYRMSSIAINVLLLLYTKYF